LISTFAHIGIFALNPHKKDLIMFPSSFIYKQRAVLHLHDYATWPTDEDHYIYVVLCKLFCCSCYCFFQFRKYFIDL